MKAVIIGASSEALHTIQKAKEHGLYVVAIDGNPEAEGLKAADKAIVVDISDEKSTIEAVEREQADFVLTVPIGRYLTTIGAVNDKLGLPGISKEMAALCTDKLAFHKRLSAKGLRSCKCYEVKASNKEQMPLSYPAILKPRYGSGSRGIYMLSKEDELEVALEAVAGEDYVFEECIAGEEYGVDGAVVDGCFHMVLLRKKENTPPPARQAVGYFSVPENDGFRQRVSDYMSQVVQCLGLSECLLHADIIRGQEGPFAIEVSARPSGHNLHNIFTPLCTGIDVAEEYIKYRLGKSYSFVPEQTKSMLIHYFDMEGTVKKVPKESEVLTVPENQSEAGSDDVIALRLWKCNIKEGDVLAPVSDGHSVMGRGYFVLEGENQEKLQKASERIKSLFL